MIASGWLILQCQPFFQIAGFFLGVRTAANSARSHQLDNFVHIDELKKFVS